MATKAADVLSGLTGGVYTAPTGTTLPSDVDDARNAAFVEAGYLSSDGVVSSIDTDSNDIVAWQGGDLVRKVRIKKDFSFKIVMLETNPTTQQIYYGNFTAGTGSGGAASGVSTISATAADYRGAWIVDVLDGVNQIRYVVPDGEVTDWDDVSYVNGDPIAYGVTVTAYADVSGNKAYRYLEAGAAS